MTDHPNGDGSLGNGDNLGPEASASAAPDQPADETHPHEGPQPLERPGDAEMPDDPHAAKRVCGAKTRNGGACKKPPLAGRTRCRLHGGASPWGVWHYNYRAKGRSRYLKHLPQQLKAGYEAALCDDRLVELRDELALLTARIQQLLERLRSAKARRGADAAQLEESLWRELTDVIALRAKTAAAEWKRLGDLNHMITKDQAALIVTALIEAAKDVIRPISDEAYRKLMARVAALLPWKPPGEER